MSAGYVFGIPADAARDCEQIAPTPVDQRCMSCRTPIKDGDMGYIRPVMTGPGAVKACPVHMGCEAVSIVGHEYGICTCTGWDTTTKAAGDELMRRLRQAAKGDT